MSSNHFEIDFMAIHTAILKELESLSTEDFRDLCMNGNLKSDDKILLFDILSTFSSIEVNLNRVVGLNEDDKDCGLLSTFLNSNNLEENPAYKYLFQTKADEMNLEILRGYIGIRHMIAHTLVKRHNHTDSLVFFHTNRRDWNNKLTKRKKGCIEAYQRRYDTDVMLNEMLPNYATYGVLSLDFLSYLRGLLIPIDRHFSNFAEQATANT